MNIVVSGASGYLGSKLASHLCRKEHKVLALSRASNKVLTSLAKKYASLLEICELDADELYLCLGKFKPDVIVSLTCCYESDPKFLTKTVAANYLFPAQLLKYAAQIKNANTGGGYEIYFCIYKPS